MAMEFTRREFIKGIGAVTVAVSVSGMLAGCGDDKVAEGSGLNWPQTQNNVTMTIQEIKYTVGQDAGQSYLYFYPKVKIESSNALPISVQPQKSFLMKLDGKTELICDDNAKNMASVYGIQVLSDKTLKGGESVSGYIYGRVLGQNKWNKLNTCYYLNVDDTRYKITIDVYKNDMSLVSSK